MIFSPLWGLLGLENHPSCPWSLSLCPRSVVILWLKEKYVFILYSFQIQFNNQFYTEDEFYAIAGYVPQDDLLLETLTVKGNFLSNAKESFDFQARIKLYDWGENER